MSANSSRLSSTGIYVAHQESSSMDQFEQAGLRDNGCVCPSQHLQLWVIDSGKSRSLVLFKYGWVDDGINACYHSLYSLIVNSIHQVAAWNPLMTNQIGKQTYKLDAWCKKPLIPSSKGHKCAICFAQWYQDSRNGCDLQHTSPFPPKQIEWIRFDTSFVAHIIDCSLLVSASLHPLKIALKDCCSRSKGHHCSLEIQEPSTQSQQQSRDCTGPTKPLCTPFLVALMLKTIVFIMIHELNKNENR
jgi:hypothetical protein